MIYISIFTAIVLIGFLLFCYVSFGIPEMISDNYYNLKEKVGSGSLFSIVMFIVGFGMMICLLDTEQGIQPFAFGSGAGLLFVSVAPNFKEMDVRIVHKAGAILSGLCGVCWCLSVNVWTTIIIGIAYALYLSAVDFYKAMDSIWYLRKNAVFHPLYWAEAAAFLDIFITYWLIV